MLVSEMW